MHANFRGFPIDKKLYVQSAKSMICLYTIVSLRRQKRDSICHVFFVHNNDNVGVANLPASRKSLIQETFLGIEWEVLLSLALLHLKTKVNSGRSLGNRKIIFKSHTQNNWTFRIRHLLRSWKKERSCFFKCLLGFTNFKKSIFFYFFYLRVRYV